jgi:hypothetical protein
MTKNFLHKDSLITIGQYAVAGLLSLLAVTWVMKLWKADLRIPFAYAGDAVVYSTFIKGIVDNGWYYHNLFVGLPTGLHMYDFPLPDNFHFLTLKLISLFTSNHALILNIFFLLTFPLTALTSLYVFRKFGVSYWPALLGSLLYTCLPYHFFRGEGHLFYAAYYMVPLMVLVILWTYLGKLHPIKRNPTTGKWRIELRSFETIFSLLVAVVIASTGAYYSFFGCFLLLVAGTLAAALKKDIYALLASVILVAVMVLTVAINLSPSIVYLRKHGNPQSMVRAPGEAETFGLKISQLLLPVTGHRLPSFAQVKTDYSYAPLNTENNNATLGLIGSLGFLILLGKLFGSRNGREFSPETPTDLLLPLSKFNMAAVLLGTIGGFSSLFALLISPQIRSYNRISIYIGFFCLFAVVVLLDSLAQRRFRSEKSRVVFVVFLGLLLIVGILDQTSKIFVPPYASLNAEFKDDRDFIARIEQTVPANSMIFQLPYIPFPEYPQVNEMIDYDHFKAYLHSRSLRWSYGALKGREGDVWQRSIAMRPLPELVEYLAFSGFNGIYVDRFGYKDRGGALESELSSVIGTGPIASNSGRLAFFSLVEYNKRLRGQYSEAEWLERQELAQHSLIISWGGGFSELEQSPEKSWRWCSSQGTLDLYNTARRGRRVVLDMSLATGYEEFSNLIVRSPLNSEERQINSEPTHYTLTLTLPPGHTPIEFISDAKRVIAPADPRTLVFRVENFQFKELR